MAGFIAYRDAAALCVYNYDGDGSAYTCNAAELNICAATNYHLSNISIEPSPANLSSPISSRPTTFDTRTSNVDVRYGARYEGAISVDYYGMTRTSSAGSSLSGAYGWSMGADED